MLFANGQYTDFSVKNQPSVISYSDDPEQIFERYLSEGLTVWKTDHMSESDIDMARKKITNHPSDRIKNLFQLDKLFAKFLKDPILKYMLDKIFADEKYHLTTFSSNTLRKKDKNKVYFHVDYPYHELSSPYPDQILGIQVIYALNDFTIENGATMYISESFNYHAFPSSFYGQQKIDYMTVPKGSVILYRGDLWHSQGHNTTDNPRVALLANFSPEEIPAKDDVVSQLGTDSDFFIRDGRVYL